ncbi:MAG: sulfatase [Clostridiales bacterium]|nr:sulfatase [Clostridiales bacterium]
MEEKRPNLIYVFADQLRYSSVGFNGDERAHTPNIDLFAQECEKMDNTVSGHPVCAPYRASLFTGQYTTGGTGMVINEIRINPNHRCFAHVLNENGYETSYIGKWHMYASQLGHHYDTKNSYIPKGEDRLGFDGYFAAYNFHHEYYAPKAYYHLDSDEKIFCKKYEPDEQTDMAIERMKIHSQSGKPFALFLSYGTPHDPWTPENVPAEYYDLFKDVEFPNPPNYSRFNDPHADGWARFMPGKRKNLSGWKKSYYAMVANLDYNVGRLLKAVEEQGLSDNTIIVFTSDHGEMFGAHGRHAKNIFYDEAVRVPFLIKWGDRLPKIKNETCFNTVDIMPTLLNMMSLPVPDTAQGTDISGCVLEGTVTDNDCLLMGTGPTAIYGDGVEWRGIRSRQYTYAVYKVDGKEMLFDNLRDPYQMNNLAKNPKYRDVLEMLKAEMFEKMKKIGDNFERNSYYKKHWVENRVIKDTKEW